MLVDVEIGLADLDGGDRVGEWRRGDGDLAGAGALEEVEAVVVVEGAELVAVVARGDGRPGEDEGRAEGVVEEDGDGGPRRRAVVVEDLGGGEGECEVRRGEESAREVGGGGDGDQEGGEDGVASDAEGVGGEEGGGGLW